MKRLAAACLLLACGCRNDRRPRDASHGSRAAEQRVVVRPPPPDAAPEPPRVVFETRDLSAWSEVAPGVQWRRATVHIVASLPAVERAEAPPDTLQWVVVRVAVARARLSIERAPGDAISLLWERSGDAVALVNGGFFEPDHRASGLVVSGGATVAPIGARGGSGVLCVADDRVDVVPVDARDGGGFAVGPEVSLAVQCGPRLIEAGGARGIRRHDGRYAARTAACVRDGGGTLDLIAAWDPRDRLRGPELYDFATMLAGASPVGDSAGCESALNLDGGPSTGVFVRAERGRDGFGREPVGPTPWGLVVRPRAPP